MNARWLSLFPIVLVVSVAWQPAVSPAAVGFVMDPPSVQSQAQSPQGQIVFVAQDTSPEITHELRLTLHRINADGSGLRQLLAVSDQLETHANPALSRDGQWVAFQRSFNSGFPHICKVRADGTGLVDLTALGGVGGGPPAWAPDGRTIAVSSPAEGFDVVLIDAETGKPQRRVTRFRASAAQDMAYAPDGKSLIVSSPPPNVKTREELQADLWEVSLIGGKVRRITSTPQDEHSPSLSPDGRQIAVVSKTEPEAPGERPVQEIFLLDRGSGQRRRITHSPHIAGRAKLQSWTGLPAWAPDGKSLVFVSNRSGDSAVDSNLFVIKLDADDPEQEPVQVTFMGYASAPDWGTAPGQFSTPNGRRKR